MPRLYEGRWIDWKQIDKQKYVGYDQWDEKWVVDGWTLRKGAILTKTDGDEITISEFFDSCQIAMDVADYINENRGEW